jgi:hypothetical protein
MLQPAAVRSSDGSDRGYEDAALGVLSHRLNNQLGIVLAHAELLETKATDQMYRNRASRLVSGVVDALATAREIKTRVQASPTVPASE